MMRNNVNPKTLKGNDKMSRIHELMGKVAPAINESRSNSVLEIYKNGPDNKVYGVVRENHEYYIKEATAKENLTVNDFNYIGGLQNKKEYVFESYAKATKQLKLKLMSLNEAYGIEVEEDTNTLLNENALAAGFGDGGTGFANENLFEEEDIDESVNTDVIDQAEEADNNDPNFINNDVDNDVDNTIGIDEAKQMMNSKLREKFELSESEADFLVNEILGCDECNDLKKKE